MTLGQVARKAWEEAATARGWQRQQALPEWAGECDEASAAAVVARHATMRPKSQCPTPEEGQLVIAVRWSMIVNRHTFEEMDFIDFLNSDAIGWWPLPEVPR